MSNLCVALLLIGASAVFLGFSGVLFVYSCTVFSPMAALWALNVWLHAYNLGNFIRLLRNG